VTSLFQSAPSHLPESPKKTSTAQPRPSIRIPPRGIGPITYPNKNDVLCGRGGRINAHAGNVQFRDLVARRKREYLAPNTKKLEKAHIAAGIVRQTREMEPSGRFLKEDANGMWFDIGDAKAIKKVGQALREDAPDVRPTTFKEEDDNDDQEMQSDQEDSPAKSFGPAEFESATAKSHQGGAVASNNNDKNNNSNKTLSNKNKSNRSADNTSPNTNKILSVSINTSSNTNSKTSPSNNSKTSINNSAYNTSPNNTSKPLSNNSTTDSKKNNINRNVSPNNYNTSPNNYSTMPNSTNMFNNNHNHNNMFLNNNNNNALSNTIAAHSPFAATPSLLEQQHRHASSPALSYQSTLVSPRHISGPAAAAVRQNEDDFMPPPPMNQFVFGRTFHPAQQQQHLEYGGPSTLLSGMSGVSALTEPSVVMNNNNNSLRSQSQFHALRVSQLQQMRQQWAAAHASMDESSRYTTTHTQPGYMLSHLPYAPETGWNDSSSILLGTTSQHGVPMLFSREHGSLMAGGDDSSSFMSGVSPMQPASFASGINRLSGHAMSIASRSLEESFPSMAAGSIMSDLSETLIALDLSEPKLLDQI
jgi:hypothetical protein